MAAIDIAIGLMVLFGWLAHVEPLTNVLPGLVATKPNFALSLVLLGIGLALSVLAPRSARAVFVRNSLAGLAFVIATATLAEWALGINLHIDELIAAERAGIGTPAPGRAPVQVDLAVLSASLGSILLGRSWWRIYPSQVLGFLASAVGGMVVLGYTYGAQEIVDLGSPNRVSLLAGPGLLAFGIGLIAANPRHLLVRQLSDPGVAGEVARRFIPTALLAVPIGAMLRLEGQQAGLYDTAMGVVLLAAYSAVLILLAGMWTGARLLRLDAERAAVTRDRDRFFELTRDLVMVSDFDGNILFLSPSWSTALGVPISEALYRSFFDFIHPEDQKATADTFAEIMAGPGSSGFQNRYRRADGSYFWVEWASRPDPSTRRVYGIARDVTDRRRAEEVLRGVSLYARGLIEASLDPLVTISPQGKVTDVNRATEDVTGRPREGLIGTDFADYFTEPELARAGYLQVLRDGLVRDYPLTIRHASGRLTDVLYNATVYRSQTGEVRGVFAAARDVTQVNRLLEERTRREVVLREQAEELRRSNSELEQFAYVASHDLQEPLRMVSGFVGLLEKRYAGQLDEDANQYIHFAVDGARRMQGLINDLLAFSRVGTRGAEPVPMNLNEVVSEALVNLRASIEEAGADIAVRELPVVAADRAQMIQLFQNLVGNAIKFRGKTPPQVRISAERQETGWRILVRDNGIGIPAGHLDEVFVIFRRLHTRDAYPGTGIGLAICKRIVERRGGQIGVESEPDKGSTFWFTVPDLDAGTDLAGGDGGAGDAGAGGGRKSPTPRPRKARPTSVS